ncbi:hypothetical protein KR044_009797 [Drosophila immigrans]|nr:hypothetical protein KR044_009797 [Drosophila immigrans]
MSTINFHPLQTHSRFFRPWETQRQTPPPPARSAKRELESGTDRVSIKTKLPAANDRKSSSSSSAYSSSCCFRESSFPSFAYSSMSCKSTPLVNVTSQPALPRARAYSMVAPQQPAPYLPTSDLNYATTPTAASFGMDRVMAEDEQLKVQRSKQFKCPYCDSSYFHLHHLKRHICMHTGERPFKCDVESCGKTFKRSDALLYHKSKHLK